MSASHCGMMIEISGVTAQGARPRAIIASSAVAPMVLAAVVYLRTGPGNYQRYSPNAADTTCGRYR
jgi:hypothetical protein